MDLNFKQYGHGQPLVIIHGLFGSLDNWHTISEKLAGHFEVYALDLRNHGRSPHSPEMNYGLLAGDVREFMRRRRMAEASVLGHSMGGKVAMQLALQYPAVVSKLIVVDIAPRAYAPRHDKMIAGMLALELAGFQSRKEIEAALAPAVPELATRQFLLKNVERSAPGGFHWRIGLPEIAQNYSRLNEELQSDQSFDKPSLFIRGEKSDYLVPGDLEAIQKFFPKSILQAIPGAGHLVHIENPKDFLAAVVHFLNS